MNTRAVWRQGVLRVAVALGIVALPFLSVGTAIAEQPAVRTVIEERVETPQFDLSDQGVTVPGYEWNDEPYVKDGKVRYKTNNAGGVLGGISNGEEIVLRVAVKATPTISIDQGSVNMEPNAWYPGHAWPLVCSLGYPWRMNRLAPPVAFLFTRSTTSATVML